MTFACGKSVWERALAALGGALRAPRRADAAAVRQQALRQEELAQQHDGARARDPAEDGAQPHLQVSERQAAIKKRKVRTESGKRLAV